MPDEIDDVEKLLAEINALHARIEWHLKEWDKMELQMAMLQHMWKKPRGNN
jgi:hypothetical protein